MCNKAALSEVNGPKLWFCIRKDCQKGRLAIVNEHIGTTYVTGFGKIRINAANIIIQYHPF